MKKLIIGFSVTVVILGGLGVVAVAFFLDTAVKRSIETVGPMLTKVDVKLESVNLSLVSGRGQLKGLFVGNPSGYKSPSAIQVGDASLAIAAGSIFSSKVVIRSINIRAPEITLETDLKGNNLSKIVANLQAATGGSSSSGTAANNKAGKKLQVDDFLITGGKIHLTITGLGGQSATVPLPEIHLTSLGQGPDGITAAELTTLVLQAVEKEAVQIAASSVRDNVTKEAFNLTKGLGNGANGTATTIPKGLGSLFKKGP